MERLRIAIVSRDADARLVAARAFDAAPEHWDVELHTEPPVECDQLVFGPDVDVPAGALQVDPSDPAGVLRSISERVRSRDGRGIVVTASAGGAGVTTVALHLAAALARRRPTCVLDLSGGVADRLGLDPSEARTWADPDAERDIELCALPVPGGFRVLLAPDPIVAGGAAPLPAARARFTNVVIDAPPEDVEALVAAETALVLVTSGSPVAARRDARLLERISSGRLALIVNRVGRGGQATRAELEMILGRRVGLELPHCPALRDVEDEAGLLSSPVHRWVRALQRLAESL